MTHTGSLTTACATCGHTMRTWGLTNREAEVLCLIAEGLDNRSIAGSMGIQTRTVEHHISSLFEKMGVGAEGSVNRRVKAVLMYLEQVRP